ncbi:MAG: hypothetical protein ABIX46_13250 [Burkholderiaceae bacterium]
MQKTNRQKTPAATTRTATATASDRKPAAPQPLDLRSLERVAGGFCELPKKYW